VPAFLLSGRGRAAARPGAIGTDGATGPRGALQPLAVEFARTLLFTQIVQQIGQLAIGLGLRAAAEARFQIAARLAPQLVAQRQPSQGQQQLGLTLVIAQPPFGAGELPDEAKSAIDQMVNNLKEQKSAIWIEIEGHTDNVGNKKYNEQLGMTRAESVKRYLYEQHQVPLHKMNVISYGEDKPAAPNTTRDGRAQNRRVVIKVLA